MDSILLSQIQKCSGLTFTAVLISFPWGMSSVATDNNI